MLRKILALFLLIMIAAACKQTIINDKVLYNRLLDNNKIMLKLVEQSIAERTTEKSVIQIDQFEGIIASIPHDTKEDLTKTFDTFLNQLRRIDVRYFNVNYTDAGNKSQLQVVNEFSAQTTEIQLQQLNIGLSNFLEYLLKQLDTKLARNEEDLFIALVPEQYKVSTNETYKAEVIIAQKVKTAKGKLSGNNFRLVYRDGSARYSETKTTPAKEACSVRALTFKFETTINGKDTVLILNHKYILEN